MVRPILKPKKPTPKIFDISKYNDIIAGLHVNMPELEIEHLSEIVVPDILKNYEGFGFVEKGPNFRGTPFDFFGIKNQMPYIIEYKASLNNFNSPGETQKRRIQEVLKIVDGLHISLLQVKLSKGEYRIFSNEEMDFLFHGRKAKLEPIIEWIKERVPKA